MSLDWNSFVTAKNVSVASVEERGVPCMCDGVRVCDIDLILVTSGKGVGVVLRTFWPHSLLHQYGL